MFNENVTPLRRPDTIKPSPKKTKPTLVKQAIFQDNHDAYLDLDLKVHEVSNDESLSFKRNGLQEKTFKQLRLGKLPVEAELDLHGFTESTSLEALTQFIEHAFKQNKRVLRIVHGKGHPDKNPIPVLKNIVNDFLRRHSLVLALTSADQRGGGTGALYVLIRKNSV